MLSARHVGSSRRHADDLHLGGLSEGQNIAESGDEQPSVQHVSQSVSRYLVNAVCQGGVWYKEVAISSKYTLPLTYSLSVRGYHQCATHTHTVTHSLF